MKKLPPKTSKSFVVPLRVPPNTELFAEDAARAAALVQQVVDEALLLALSLAWAPKGKTLLYQYIQRLGQRMPNGRMITLEEVGTGLERLQATGRVVRSEAGACLTEPERSTRGADVLMSANAAKWRTVVFQAEEFHPDRGWGYHSFRSAGNAQTLIRWVLFGGSVEAWRILFAREYDSHARDALGTILTAPFDARLWDLVAPPLRNAVLSSVIAHYCERLGAAYLPIIDWAYTRYRGDPTRFSAQFRFELGEVLLMQGRADALDEHLDADDSQYAVGLKLLGLAVRGQWVKAAEIIPIVFKPLQQQTGRRKHLFPDSLIWLYPLSLIALGDGKSLAAARKFCINEFGRRSPVDDGGWGMWALAIDMRLGDAPLDAAFFNVPLITQGSSHHWLVQRAILRTWVGKSPPNATQIKELEDLLGILRAARHTLFADLLENCLKIARGEDPAPGFFIAKRAEAWREGLAAIEALQAAPSAKAQAAATRLLWNVEITPDGVVTNITPWQQKPLARGGGWGKAAAASVVSLLRNKALDPLDAALLRHTNKLFGGNAAVIDHVDSLQALVGHPRVVINSDFSRLVRVSESQPTIEVFADQKNACWRFVLDPMPPAFSATRQDDVPYWFTAEQRQREERARTQCIIHDGRDEARLVRFTAAQLRVAQIVHDGLKVPLAAQAEMAAAMKVIAAHFALHSETELTEAARMLPTPTKLRAEITPERGGLSLRLVVVPFVQEGLPGAKAGGKTGTSSDPLRFAAGSGRSRVVTRLGTESVGVQRDLPLEKSLVAAVETALDDAGINWEAEGDRLVTHDPESSLALLELLPKHDAIEALDWPEGKSVSVRSLTPQQVKLSVQNRRDWFAVDAKIEIDESSVMRLAELLTLVQGSDSRFIQLAEGQYLALTAQLRRQLDDLSALVAPQKVPGAKAGESTELVLSQAAAMWLNDSLDDWASESDKPVQARLAALRQALDSQPTLPPGLQATLRDYQATGIQWLQRLGKAGFGACLADDMGLGKTIQTLAVLLDRSAAGPALVVAPTSLISNWIDEAARFAPALNCIHYANSSDEATRKASVDNAGPGDVVFVTYTLVQQGQTHFDQRVWHTLVLDEAQAIKNAAALRSQAVYALQADFRIALSGTPVENRLEELWSIMNFLNPGLLGTSAHFGARFVNPILADQAHVGRTPTESGDTLRRLKRIVSPFLLRRTKAQVLTDLPERTEITLRAEPGHEERAHYEALRRRALASAAEVGADPTARFKVLAELMRLRRASCDPRLTTSVWPGAGAKVQLFARVAQDLVAGLHRTLVFSQFTDFLDLLGAELTQLGLTHHRLDGSTPAPERGRLVNAFQRGEGQFFLISLKAGGYGLNLTAADYVIIADPWWNPAAEDQAMGRAHRIGQRRPVTAYRLVTAGTIEERIIDLHTSKRALADGLLDGGDSASGAASVDELLALLKE